jgi:hypothetical protein
MMRTLFLQAPSFDGFDGGAGSRYQARREIKSFWFPTWLAQPAALIPNSKLVDAPPHNQTLADVAPMARDFDMAVLHTSTPSFASDVKVAERLKAENPNLKIGLIGAKVAVQAMESLRDAPSSTGWPATSSTSRCATWPMATRSPRSRASPTGMPRASSSTMTTAP